MEAETTKWCPLIKTRIMGGEPYCSITSFCYPYVGKNASPCNKNWVDCDIFKEGTNEPELIRGIRVSSL